MERRCFLKNLLRAKKKWVASKRVEIPVEGRERGRGNTSQEKKPASLS